MTRLLVFGGTGFLGGRLCAVGTERGFDVTATHFSTPPGTSYTHSTAHADWLRCDITEGTEVDELVASVRPDAIINAAYVQSGPTAATVCGDAAGWVAAAAERAAARLVHVSTDLVFDGNLGRSYGEDDVTNPLSDYGVAKLRGEELVANEAPSAVIARTSIIYGHPRAPQETLTRRALEPAPPGQNPVTFFTNEWRSPVHVDDLATALVDLTALPVSGVLHVAGAERINRLGFATLLAAYRGRDPSTLVGKPQDPALGPRPEDVSLDVQRAESLGLSLPGVSNRLAPTS